MDFFVGVEQSSVRTSNNGGFAARAVHELRDYFPYRYFTFESSFQHCRQGIRATVAVGGSPSSLRTLISLPQSGQRRIIQSDSLIPRASSIIFSIGERLIIPLYIHPVRFSVFFLSHIRHRSQCWWMGLITYMLLSFVARLRADSTKNKTRGGGFVHFPNVFLSFLTSRNSASASRWQSRKPR